MLNMTGQLINVFKSPVGQNKNGEEYGGQDKLQILGEVELPNGQTRMEMFTLTTHNLNKFEACLDLLFSRGYSYWQSHHLLHSKRHYA